MSHTNTRSSPFLPPMSLFLIHVHCFGSSYLFLDWAHMRPPTPRFSVISMHPSLRRLLLCACCSIFCLHRVVLQELEWPVLASYTCFFIRARLRAFELCVVL